MAGWTFVKPEDFRDQVLCLPPSIRKKLTSVMYLLSESTNPLEYSRGGKKLTKYGEFYTIKLSGDFRLAYDVKDYTTRKIILYRVGDHDFVYGKK